VTTPSSVALDRFDGDARIALRIVREGMRLARSLEGHVAPSFKSDASPLTIADLAVQAVAAAHLGAACPHDPLVAEEEVAAVRAGAVFTNHVLEIVRRVLPDATAEDLIRWVDRGAEPPGRRFWTLDPIDGTKGFLQNRQYAIVIALIVEGKVQVGVIGCPHLSLDLAGDTISTSATAATGGVALAVRGGGAWWAASDCGTWRRLTVSTRREPRHARVVQSFEPSHGHPRRLVRILHALGHDLTPVLMDSQAKHVTIAAGVNDLLLRLPPDERFHDAIWDQAAGSLLIEEAGGLVTDLAGQPLDFTCGRRLLGNSGVVASNGTLHPAALAAVRCCSEDT
jgi:3'(2'), 5'-bisphosphate nucleotidase